MPDVKVYYRPFGESNLELFPTPFVSRSFEAVEAGALRLGFVENYEVNGFLSGFSGVYASGYEHSPTFKSFSKSPGVLSISSDGNDEFFLKTGFVTSFSIPKNNFLSSSGLFPYSLKFKVFDVLKNIKSPSFEYSFTENQDRSVGLGVKISAIGLVSIYDAQKFVEELSSTYNLTGFAPIHITTGSNWSLLSSKKTIDRAKFSYSLEREYRCVPSGYIESGFPFSEITKVSQSLSKYGQSYASFEFDTNLEILADPNKVYQNSKSWDSFESNLFSNKNYLEEIAKFYVMRQGAPNLTDFILSNISISKNSGAKELGIKFSLLSGKADDFKGFFNYSVRTDEDLSLGERSITLDGEFVSKGDLTNRREYVEKWLTAQFTPEGLNQVMSQTYSTYSAPNDFPNGAGFYTYAKGLTGIAKGISSGRMEIGELGITWNSGLADFKLNCSFDNGVRITPGSEISFSVDVQASVPIYKFIPAANIEGHYIIQNLLCKTAETAKIDVNGRADDVKTLDSFFGTGVKIVSELFNDFIKTDFAGTVKSANYTSLVPESLTVSSGLADASFSISYGVMYSGNKNYNPDALLGIPELNLGVATKSTSSARTLHLFGR